MRTLLVGDCALANSYSLADPDAPSEQEFQAVVAKALSCVFSDYDCIPFTGAFQYNDECYRPDLALVAKDRSHWFVIEVELVAHSFQEHVLPQVRAFQYGEPQRDCTGLIAKWLEIPESQAQTLVGFIPRAVAVVANRRIEKWEWALRALSVNLLTVSCFSGVGGAVMEVDGSLEVVAKSIGFGAYSSTDRSLHFHRRADLPVGKIQLHDPHGAPSLWTVVDSPDGLWITKDVGRPDIEHGVFVQIVRTVDGKLSLRVPRHG